MVFMPSHSNQVKLLVPLAVLALLFVLPGAAAQVAGLDVTVPAESVEAMPMGAPAAANVTVAYNCVTTIGDIEVTAEVKDDAGGAAGVEGSPITPETVPDCNPGDSPSATVTVTYSADLDQIAGTKVDVDVTATNNPTGQGDGESVTKTASFTVGPYVDVTFAPNITTIDAAAGDEVPVSVLIESKSNTVVMAMPSISAPATWERPDALPRNVKSPLEDGEDGTDTMEFVIKIPADASGTETLELTLFAHSLTDTYAESEKVVFPFTVNVAPGSGTATSGTDGDSEESPALPVAPLVLVGVALVVLARRR